MKCEILDGGFVASLLSNWYKSKVDLRKQKVDMPFKIFRNIRYLFH